MATKTQEGTITGVVDRANDNGVLLVGETKWRNYTNRRQWTEKLEVGDRAVLIVEGDFINGFTLLPDMLDEQLGDEDEPPTSPRPRTNAEKAGIASPAPAPKPTPAPNGNGNGNGHVSDHDRLMARMSALKQAVNFATAQVAAGNQEVKSTDALKIADIYLQWLMLQPTQPAQ